MPQEVLLSRAGFEKLQKELEQLKGPIRQNVAEALREAKSHGDLRENAAYHEAKLNQTRLEGRIADLEKVLQTAKIVDRPEAAGESAHLGSKVTLLDLGWKEEMEVTIVGSYEADPAHNLISITSPLGSALIGRGSGEEFDFEAPAGIQRYRVVSVVQVE
jgi:transcription elongation factor GreA